MAKQDKEPVIKILDPNKTYRSNTARDIWYQFLKSQEGKTVAEFTAAAAKADLQPKGDKGEMLSKNKHYAQKGTNEPAKGWLSFFMSSQQGVAELR